MIQWYVVIHNTQRGLQETVTLVFENLYEGGQHMHTQGSGGGTWAWMLWIWVADEKLKGSNLEEEKETNK